jgi:hypothetical protein
MSDAEVDLPAFPVLQPPLLLAFVDTCDRPDLVSSDE